jgi:aspartyl protease family protein
MNGDQIANIAFLGLLGAAIAGSYFMSQRGNLCKTAQQAAVWGLIFVGVIAVVGMWSDIRNTVSPRQQIGAAGEIVLPRQPNGHYYLTLDVNDVPVEFVVDTGASQIVLSQTDAARVGIDPASLRYLGLANTANGQVRTAPVWLDRVSLDDLQDFDVPAVVNDGQMDGSLLGMTYIDSFDTIQIRDGELILQRD